MFTTRNPILTGAFLYCFLLGTTSTGSARLVLGTTTPKTKMGVSFTTAHSSNALVNHEGTSSWWYSWGAASNGFYGGGGGLCPLDQAVAAVDDARINGNMDFVPMFWGGVPTLPLDTDTHANLEAATYLMGFNEPEFAVQANLTALEAAQMWPELVDIATAYGLQIVGPCSENGSHGREWYRQWTIECNALYGKDCDYDFVCIHMYYQPYPCDSATVPSWACIGQNTNAAMTSLDYWYTTYGNKSIWVTEFGCAPWGSTNGCDAAKQTALMEQLVPVLEASPKVFRYAWYTTYNTEPDWVGSSLNEPVWQITSGKGCPGRIWVSSFGTATWQVRTCVFIPKDR